MTAAASYCCQMRRRFFVGIVAEDRAVPLPVDLADCVVCWEPIIVFRIRFCPFCGVRLDPQQPVRVPVNTPVRL